MCYRVIIVCVISILLVNSCSSMKRIERIREGEVALKLSVGDDAGDDVDAEDDSQVQVVVDSIRGSLSDTPLIMKAIKDSETGEMVATDVINASKVVARFRNVSERAGYVTVSFDVSVPSGMASSAWQLKIFPYMKIQKDTVALDPLFVTGSDYRGKQLRGYERYRDFIASIITDPDDLLRIGQLEIFLQRHFPSTYQMKTDSSYVSDPVAANLFGVTQRDAFEHYRKHLRWRMNERRKSHVVDRFRRYVKDPILSEGIRLDTLLSDPDEDFVYRYVQEFRSRPGLKKVNVFLRAQLFEDGECRLELPFPEELTFYISSLSSLTDEIIKYKMEIRHRRITGNTKAFIDFEQGSAVIDTTLEDNASEFGRIRECIEDVIAMDEYALDSLVIAASCSPEGSYRLNERLSALRSDAVREYIGRYVPADWKDSLRTSAVPENWHQFVRLVENDTVLTADVKRMIGIWVAEMGQDHDEVEERISRLPQYRYMREKIYPKLRTVSFDFHLHRIDMVQDTVWTTELDTVYMDGLQAIRDLDYKKAVTLLRPYGDYNAALAFLCADYNHSAMDILNRLDDTDPRVCYMKSLVLARLRQYSESLKYYELAIAYDPAFEFRANLDPEMHEIVKLRYKENETDYNIEDYDSALYSGRMHGAGGQN